MDPKGNGHNLEYVNKINEALAKLISFNQNGKINFDSTNIPKLPASEITMVDNKRLNKVYDNICKILKYDPKIEEKKTSNKRVKNGLKIIYSNIPTLSATHFHEINKIIGDPTNRFLFHPDTDDELVKFAKLITITNKPDNHILHWDIINITIKQELFLQTFREIALKLNIKYNTLNELDDFEDVSKTIQQAQLSQLATKICNNRYIPSKYIKRKNDKFWIHNNGIWKFFGSLLSKGRVLYRAIGSLMRDTCKYAFGKRLAARSNWCLKTFQIVGDITGKKKQQLCTEANNLKRAYEMKIAENIITTQFKQITELYYDLQTYITNSDDLTNFCRTLFDTNDAEYNINLFSIYKKTEIAIINASQSTSKFRLDIMNIKRDLLKFLSILKHSNDVMATDMMKQIKNDIHILKS